MTKTALAIISTLLFIAATFLSSCGAGSVTAPAPTTTTTRTSVYDISAVATRRLLQDTGDTLTVIANDKGGVHFISESTSVASGTYTGSRGEGDMVFPDRVRMDITTMSGDTQEQIELIAVNGLVFSRSDTTGGAWQTSSRGYLPPDPQSIRGYIDFARGSRNFGQESLPDGRKTYHLQLDVDTALAAQEAKKHTRDPAQQVAIEATRESATTVDLWIGIDDLLVYQEIVNITNMTSGVTTNINFTFSRWGEAVQITRPCEPC
ncbi:MAG: hypothetical protein ACYC6B_05805 [Thermoleophilia bacterium]